MPGPVMDVPDATDVPKQRYQGVQKESAGYKLLASMGWKEGEGLGASKQGIKEHIRVKKKFENWGVGAVEAADRARDWSAGMVEFHRVLSTLSEITSQHASKRSSGGGGGSSSSDESDASDGELARRRKVAAGDGGQGKAKRKRKGGAPDASSDKAVKKETKKRKKAKQAKQADAEPSAGQAAAPLGKRLKVATHLGRFKKRESAKTVKNYSNTDLAAILGADPFAAVAAAAAEVRSEAAAAAAAAHATSSESDEGAAAPAPAAVPRRPSEQQRARQREAAAAAADQKEQEEAEASEGRWWSGYFTRSGRMGALRRAPREDPAARGFSEQDQTELYTRAQDGASQGRVGLGRSSMPKKVAGARWEGKRTRLGSDSEGEGEDGAEEAAEQDEEQVGVVIVMPASQGQTPGAAAAPAASAPELAAVKWRRAAAAALKGSGKSRLKLARLHKAVMRQEGLEKRHKAEVARLVTAAVEASGKFSVTDDVVQLAS